MDVPAWLAFALVSPLFWAVVHVLDAYCVDELFDRPWLATVASGFTMLAALPFLAAGFAVVGWVPVGVEVWLMCLGAGAFFMSSQVLYFEALARSESGIVAAYWNLTPVLVLGLCHALFGEVLTPARYAGVAVLIAAGTCFWAVDGNVEARLTTFLLMFAGCWLQAGYFLTQKAVFPRCPVYQTFVLCTAGMAAFAAAPLALRRGRRAWAANWPRVRPAVGFLLLIEACNLVAVATSQFAVGAASPSLVAAVESTIPAYTFGVSLGLWWATRKYGEADAGHRLGWKVALVAVMAAGVWLVS